MSRCIRRSLVGTVALASLCLAEPSFAAERPYAEADPLDKVLVDYDPRAVVPITGVYRTATEILLGEDESILHVAVGDATAWDVAVEKNILSSSPRQIGVQPTSSSRPLALRFPATTSSNCRPALDPRTGKRTRFSS